jgi:hypothetical protein
MVYEIKQYKTRGGKIFYDYEQALEWENCEEIAALLDVREESVHEVYEELFEIFNGEDDGLYTLDN